MQNYIDLLKDILANGRLYTNRTGIRAIGVWGRMLHYNLQDGFPAVTTKKLAWKSVVGELLWFIKGSTNVKDLQAMGVTIWDEWAKEDGELGPVYGKQWRRWEGVFSNMVEGGSDEWRIRHPAPPIDQLQQVIDGIKFNPDSRRLLVSAWNPTELPNMALPPCHYAFQFRVDQPAKRLHCQFNMRSTDAFLGLPFNIASYALLTHLVAHVTGLQPGQLVVSLSDVHIYENHLEAVYTQLGREPQPLPKLLLVPAHPELKREVTCIDDFRPDDIGLVDYRHHPAIKADVAV